MHFALATAKWEVGQQVALSPVRVGNCAASVAKNRQRFHTAWAWPMFGGLPGPGGISNEQRGTSNSEASAAVVRAPRMARSSSALPTQWRSLLVDHVEQAWLGFSTSHDHRTEVRGRAQRDHWLPRR